MNEIKKRCCDCGRWLDRSEFHKNRATNDGLQRTCKVCNNQRSSAAHMAKRDREKIM